MKTRRLLGSAVVLAVTAGLLPAGAISGASAATTCVPPTGLSPDDGFQTTTPARKDLVLSWLPVGGATSYDVQISANEDFSNSLALAATTNGTRFTVPTASLQTISYFWRVSVSGARCWSDNGSTPAASFTHAWNDAPTALAPSGTVAGSNLSFSWKPIKDAAFYEVEVIDHATQKPVGRCFTDLSQLTLANLINGTERLPQQTDCMAPTDLDVSVAYDWRVRAFDQTNVSIDGKPYATPQSETFTDAPKDVPFGTPQVTKVTPRFGSQAGGATIVVDGSSFAVGSTRINVGGVTIDASDVSVNGAGTQLSFVLPSGMAVGPTHVIALVGSSSSALGSQYTDKFSVVAASGGLFTESFTNAEVSPWSAVLTFTVSPTVLSGSLATPTGLTAFAQDANGALTVDCSSGCGSTPTISWTPDPAAAEYRIYLWADVNHTQLIRVYETHAASLTTRDNLLDNQAGNGYYVQVQSCTSSACGPVSVAKTFRKRSAPVSGITLPAQGASLSDVSITLGWADYRSTNGTALEASQYLVQVATDCSFSTLIDSAQVDQPEFTSPDKTYGNGTYYWRVAALDNSGNPLTWGPGPNKDATTTSGSCGDLRRFTVDRSAGSTNGTVASPTAAQPLEIHYGTAVNGLTLTNVLLIEASTQKVIPGVVTLLPDGASVLPTLKDLVPGEFYVIRVVGTVTDSLGDVVQPINNGSYRAATRIDAPGVFVHKHGTWNLRGAHGALNGKAMVTKGVKRPDLSMRFRGSVITVGYCTGPLNGKIAIYVDGTLKKKVQTYNSFTKCGKPGTSSAPRVRIAGINGNVQHTVRVVATGEKGARKGTSASIDWFDIN